MKRTAAVLGLWALAFASAFESPRETSHAQHNVFAKELTRDQRFSAGLGLSLADQGKPQQIHLALHGQDADGYATGYNVAWYTEADVDCSVNWGAGTSLGSTTATAARKQYIKKGGYHHNVVIGPLAEQTRYSYQVVCGADASETQTSTFGVRMVAGQPKTMSVYGDMGYLGSKERPMKITIGLAKNWSAVPTRDTLEALKDEGAYDAVFHVGDVGYADDEFAHNILGGDYEPVFNGYMNWMQNISATRPYMVTVGNHESECHSPSCVIGADGPQLANFSAYNARFHMPSQEAGGVLNMWYSFKYGPAHFTAINTETDFPGAGEEKKGDSGIFPAGGFGADGEYLAWLEADLVKAAALRDAGKISFLIVGGHRPIGDGIEGVQALFKKYAVDLYLCGHDHSYARSYKSCAGQACRGTLADPGVTTHVVVGGAGNDETDYGHEGPISTSPNTPFFTAEMATGLLTFKDANTLEWKLVSSLDKSRILDSFTLTKQQ